MPATRREYPALAITVARATDPILQIDYASAQAIADPRGVVVDLDVVRYAEVELDAMQERQVDQQARQRTITREDRGDLVHPLLVRAEAIDLGFAHAAERAAAIRRCGTGVTRGEEVNAAGPTTLGATQRGLGGGE